jgi:hypothetical protein
MPGTTQASVRMVLIYAGTLLGSVGFLVDHNAKLRRSLLPTPMARLLSRLERHVKESAFDDVRGVTWENCSLTGPWRFVNQGENWIRVEVAPGCYFVRTRTWESSLGQAHSGAISRIGHRL